MTKLAIASNICLRNELMIVIDIVSFSLPSFENFVLVPVRVQHAIHIFVTIEMVRGGHIPVGGRFLRIFTAIYFFSQVPFHILMTRR